MNRALALILKILVVAALLAAIFDLPLPDGTQPRSRTYLLDLSPSVLLPRGENSLSPEDGWKIIRSDATQFDTITVIGFSKSQKILFQGSPKDLPQTRPPFLPEPESNLGEALESILIHPSEEVLLLSDARSTENRTRLEKALLILQERKIQVHTLPLGPRSPRDICIRELRGPSRIQTGKEFSLEVDLLSTRDLQATITLEGHTGKQVTLVRHQPQTILFQNLQITQRTEFTVRLLTEDDCPQNNQARWIVEPDRSQRKALLLSESPSDLLPLLRSTPSMQVVQQTSFSDTFGFDLIILDSFSAKHLSPGQQSQIVEFVTGTGGGLLMMGGPDSFAPGGYTRTAVEEILPTWTTPGEELAILFLLDRSGSMAGAPPGQNRRKWDSAIEALENVLDSLRPQDRASVLTFAGDRTLLSPLTTDRKRLVSALEKDVPNGPTVLSPALKEGLRVLEETTAPRKAILILSDGNTEEELSSFSTLGKKLENQGIQLLSIQTGNPPSMALQALGPVQPVSDWKKLSEQIRKWVVESQKWIIRPASPNQERGLPSRLNRVTLKPGATLLASFSEHPLLAIRPAGKGMVGIATFALRDGWMGTLTNVKKPLLQLIESLTPAPLSPYTLSGRVKTDRLHLVARGPRTGPVTIPIRVQETSKKIAKETHLLKTNSTTWEKEIPRPDPGISWIEPIGFRGGSLEVSIPYEAEYLQLGTNRTLLKAVSDQTKGRFIERKEDLKGPGAGRIRWQSGRPYFLVAGILFFLLDILLAAFWKPSRRYERKIE